MSAGRRAGGVVVHAVAGLLCCAGLQAEETAVAKATSILAEAMVTEAEGPRLQAMELAAGLSSPRLEDAARRAASSNDRVERTWALEALGRMDAAGNRAVFVDAMTSPYRTVRVRAVLALASIKDPDVVPLMASMLEKDVDPDLRALAARALGAMGGEDARSALRGALDDPHPVVQSAAVLGLVESGDTEVGIGLLRRAGKAEPQEASRLLGLAGQVPNRGLIPHLAELLASESSTVRIAAAAAILRIDERAR